MEGRDDRPHAGAGHRIPEVVEMAVHDVELFDVPPDFAERDGPVGIEIARAWLLVPQRPLHRGHQAGRCGGVARGEERYLVAPSNQLVGQCGDHALCSAIA